jgi:hypothetical protein
MEVFHLDWLKKIKDSQSPRCGGPTIIGNYLKVKNTSSFTMSNNINEAVQVSLHFLHLHHKYVFGSFQCRLCVFCKAENRRIISKALYQLDLLHLEILINLPS